jgi:hypothetical protein
MHKKDIFNSSFTNDAYTYLIKKCIENWKYV